MNVLDKRIEKLFRNGDITEKGLMKARKDNLISDDCFLQLYGIPYDEVLKSIDREKNQEENSGEVVNE